jgi:glycolate oxidase iron-sulfur subunit
MDMLKDFEKDLNKCSKCGLCEAACPLFKISPNDCVASKGKFIMLHGVTKGDLKLSKNINKYIDMCLKCGKCNAFCPSGIDVCKILNVAKYEYMKNTFAGKFINFLESRMVFGLFMKFGKVLSEPFRPKKKKIENPVAKILYFKGCLNQICPRTDK